jgi:hypothetical protein
LKRVVLNHIRGGFEEVLLRDTRDACNEPYQRLAQRGAEMGFRFEGVRDQPLSDVEWVVFWDTWCLAPNIADWLRRKLRNQRDLVGEVFGSAKERPKLALVLFEPPSIFPHNDDRAIHEKFDVVFTWNSALLAQRPDLYRYLFLPSPENLPMAAPLPFAQKKLLCDISGYKFSSHPRELYTERRRTIRFFETHYAADFDLFGEGWNPSPGEFRRTKMRHWNAKREMFRSYRGRCASKADVFPKYKFTLCYENMIEPGFVSVKLFDALRSDVVPVYLGAPDVEQVVDSAAFIDRRKFASDEELGRYLSNMDEREYESYRAAAASFIRSERFRRLCSENFARTFLQGLGLWRPSNDAHLSGD